AYDVIRTCHVTGVQTCALPICGYLGPPGKGWGKARIAVLIVPHRNVLWERLIFFVLIRIAVADDHHIRRAIVGEQIAENLDAAVDLQGVVLGTYLIIMHHTHTV